MTADDGSRVEVADQAVNGQREVIQTGPSRMWDDIEQVFSEWEELGQPGWHRFGLTVQDTQTVWLDDPHGPYTWQLQQP